MGLGLLSNIQFSMEFKFVAVCISVLISSVKGSELCPQHCSCNTGTVNTDSLEVRCRGIGLKELPQQLPSASSYSVIVSDNDIETITSRDYLDRINHLDISNNKITNISREALVQIMQRVRYLYLNGNRFTCLPLRAGDHLHLNEIRIDHNPWNCSCMGLLQEVFHSDFVKTMTDDLKCVDVPPYVPHVHDEDQWLDRPIHQKSHFRRLMEKDGFMASFVALVGIGVIAVIIAIMYSCKHSNDRRRKQLQEPKMEDSSDTESFDV